MMFTSSPLRPFIACLILFAIARVSPAQTDPTGLLGPFPPETDLQLGGSARFQENGHVKRTDDDFRVSIYESQGRWELMNTYRVNPTIGYSIRWINIDGSIDVIPDSLTDTSIAFGTPIKQFGNGWFVAASAGIGYAGSNAFGAGDAWYAKGTALLGKELGPDSSIIIGLDYNGNRSSFPDVPFPGFAYGVRLFPQLLGTIGFPDSAIRWQPVPEFSLRVGYSIPNLFSAQAEYGVTKSLRAIASFQTYSEPFHVDGIGDQQRLFYSHESVEAGVKYAPTKDLAFVATVGYSFGQEFNVGFDSRDMDRVISVSDEPYFRVGLELAF